MRAGWEISKLADLCETFADGDWIEKKDQSKSGIRLVQTGNVGNGVFRGKDDSRRYISQTTFARLHCTEIFPGDILISRLPDPVGRGCLIPETGEKMITAVDCTIIRLKPGCIANYLVYYTQSAEYQHSVVTASTGTTRQRISRKNLGEIKIPIPTLPEQQHIVDVLDLEFAKIDAMKANAEQSLQAAKDLFMATMKRELEPKKGWKKRRLGDICEIFNGGTPSTSIKEYWDGGIQWITPKDMGRSKEMYVSRCERNISKEGVERSSAKVLPERSVIVSSRAPIGYVAINSVPMATNQGCKGFIPGKDLYPEFLYFFLLSSTELLNKLGTGATFKEVSGRKLAEILLDYPDIQEQQEIAKQILSLSQSCSLLQENYQKTLSLCDDLKQALLRKAFNGEL